MHDETDINPNKNYIHHRDGHVFTGRQLLRLFETSQKGGGLAKIGFYQILGALTETELQPTNPRSRNGL